MPVTQDVLNIS